ncbi:hypothetical protein RhiirA4_463023 [Rhizophagus irregularis]|uniref:Uncharacterized protein n=1 Tax=Rhizophagus irregularis TaxID=588596 RepID=A0A2I1GM33_9GLOM|nr:hypothetical protein RhiirA4_463023 [Rhizophagus irregularis]
MAIDKVEISTQTEDVELNEDIQDEQTIKGTQIEEYQIYSIAQSYCIYCCTIKDKKSFLLNNNKVRSQLCFCKIQNLPFPFKNALCNDEYEF